MKVIVSVILGLVIISSIFNNVVFADNREMTIRNFDGVINENVVELSGKTIDFALNDKTGLLYVATDFGIEIVDINTFKKINQISNTYGAIEIDSIKNRIFAPTFVCSNNNCLDVFSVFDGVTNKEINKIQFDDNSGIVDFKVNEKTGKIFVLMNTSDSEGNGRRSLYIIDENSLKIEKKVKVGDGAMDIGLDVKTNTLTVGQKYFDFNTTQEKSGSNALFYNRDAKKNLLYRMDDGIILEDDNGIKIKIPLHSDFNKYIISDQNQIFLINTVGNNNKVIKLDIGNVIHYYEKLKQLDAENKKNEAQAKAKEEKDKKIAEEKSRPQYSDDKIGYSFRYPPDWKIKNTPNTKAFDGNLVVFEDKFGQTALVLLTHFGKFTPMQHIYYLGSIGTIYPYGLGKEYTTNSEDNVMPTDINGYFTYVDGTGKNDSSQYLFTNERGAVFTYIGSERDIILSSFVMNDAIKSNSDDYNAPNNVSPYKIPSWLGDLVKNNDEKLAYASLRDYLYDEGIVKDPNTAIPTRPTIPEWRTKILNAWKNNIMTDNDLVVAYQYMADKDSFKETEKYASNNWPQKSFSYDGNAKKLFEDFKKQLPKGMIEFNNSYLNTELRGSLWTIYQAYTTEKTSSYGIAGLAVFKYKTFAEAENDFQNQVHEAYVSDVIRTSDPDNDLKDHCVHMSGALYSATMCGRGNIIYVIDTINGSNLSSEELIRSLEKLMK